MDSRGLLVKRDPNCEQDSCNSLSCLLWGPKTESEGNKGLPSGEELVLGEAREDKAAWEPEVAEVAEPDLAEVVAKVAVSNALFSCVDWGT